MDNAEARPQSSSKLGPKRKREAALLRALETSPDPAVREEAAEQLFSVGTARALPCLVLALKDPVLWVRHDALWAIESICGLRPATLACWLHLDINHPSEVFRRVSRWWRSNRRYLEGNDLVGAPLSRPTSGLAPRAKTSQGVGRGRVKEKPKGKGGAGSA